MFCQQNAIINPIKRFPEVKVLDIYQSVRGFGIYSSFCSRTMLLITKKLIYLGINVFIKNVFKNFS